MYFLNFGFGGLGEAAARQSPPPPLGCASVPVQSMKQLPDNQTTSKGKIKSFCCLKLRAVKTRIGVEISVLACLITAIERGEW
jgi:hypothetical protein